MSPQSRHTRFLAPVPSLTPSLRRALADVDHVRHSAYVAEVDGTVAGTGRYVRYADGSGRADLALEIPDDFQGLGVGTLLLRVLLDSARRADVARLECTIAPGNRRARGPVQEHPERVVALGGRADRGQRRARRLSRCTAARPTPSLSCGSDTGRAQPRGAGDRRRSCATSSTARCGPVVRELEHANTYPEELIEQMKELGIFGLAIPEPYGDAPVSHALLRAGHRGAGPRLDEPGRGDGRAHRRGQAAAARSAPTSRRTRYLPRMATGELRATMALTEPGGGSDLQAMRTVARRDGDELRRQRRRRRGSPTPAGPG